jgi:hypothetical protein
LLSSTYATLFFSLIVSSSIYSIHSKASWNLFQGCSKNECFRFIFMTLSIPLIRSSL